MSRNFSSSGSSLSMVAALSFVIAGAALGCGGGDGSGAGGQGGGNGSGAGQSGGSPPTCDVGCPSGYSCDDGVCQGGDETKLDFAIRTVPVSGKITINGKAPGAATDCDAGTGQINVVFDGGPKAPKAFAPVDGSFITAYVPCTATDGAFSTRLPPGKYQVMVDRGIDSTTIPYGTFEVNDALAVDKATSDLAFDLKTVKVSGHLTIDGKPPKPAEGCNENQVLVSFTGKDASFYGGFVDCATSDGSFTAEVAPGTYRVIAEQQGGGSSFPDGSIVVESSFDVSAPMSATFAAKTVPVSGHVLVDGKAPTQTEGCLDGQVTLYFSDDQGNDFQADVACDATDGAFSTRGVPGTFHVLGAPRNSTLPGLNFPLATALTIPSAGNKQLSLVASTVKITGHLTVDGQPPMGNGCIGNQVELYFYDDNSAGFDGYIDCDSTDGSFSATIAAGTYHVTANQQGTETSFPDAYFTVEKNFDAKQSMDVTWALTTAAVSGKFTLDGMGPMATANCTGDDPQVNVTFFDDTSGNFVANIPCSATDGSFSTRVAPGNYHVRASQAGTDLSNVPLDATFYLVDEIAIH